MTLAERYNLETARLLPHMAPDLQVDPAITRATEIDEMSSGAASFWAAWPARS